MNPDPKSFVQDLKGKSYKIYQDGFFAQKMVKVQYLGNVLPRKPFDFDESCFMSLLLKKKSGSFGHWES